MKDQVESLEARYVLDEKFYEQQLDHSTYPCTSVQLINEAQRRLSNHDNR